MFICATIMSVSHCFRCNISQTSCTCPRKTHCCSVGPWGRKCREPLV